MAWWKCPKCGLELSYKEVCESGGHKHDEINVPAKSKEDELEKAAKRAARTGTRTDLQAYLRLRRIYR